MEVHHHPDLHHKPKAWKEYFLEFLMIFLAVTLGFFAESYREHLNDQAKEKEYMQSMLGELKKDTANIGGTIEEDKTLVKGTDSLIQILMLPLNNNDTALNALKYFFKYTTSIVVATISDGTISQLKNNGGLRLLKKHKVAAAIIFYYNTYEILLNGQTSYMAKWNDKMADQASHIFNYLPDVKDLIDTTHGLKYPEITQQFPVMITKDRPMIIAFANNVLYYRGLFDAYLSHLTNQKESAVNLIALIRKEYHLK